MTGGFPEGFVWGAATSAAQIEGAVRADGRGESIWDRFVRVPGKVRNGDTADVACDHYRRYEADLDLMRSLGLGAYRFSIAWPRIFPAGSGPANRAGLDFYRRLAEGLRERGIEPLATLYHWDLPQALQDRGGWAERETAERFAAYAETVFSELGDVVSRWLTQNEPWVVAYLGHAFGSHAPGIEDWSTALRVGHHVLLAHGLAVEAFRAGGPAAGEVGLTLDFSPVYPDTDSEGDAAAAWRMDGFRNRWFADAALRGVYPDDMVADYERRWGPLSFVRDGDLARIAAPIDFLGVNYYSPTRVRANARSPFFELDALPPRGPATSMGWEVVPDGLYELLLRLKEDYGDLPLVITENGASYDDAPPVDGVVDDPARLAFLRGHVDAVRRALAAGVDVRGYFVWSLLDNFEWAEGYTRRFGIVYVDFETQRRVPKRSGLWYRDLIAGNGSY